TRRLSRGRRPRPAPPRRSVYGSYTERTTGRTAARPAAPGSRVMISTLRGVRAPRYPRNVEITGGGALSAPGRLPAVRPLLQRAPLDRRGHQVGEAVRGAGEGGDPQRGQGRGVGPVVAGRALVGERQHHHDLHPRGLQRTRAAHHVL